MMATILSIMLSIMAMINCVTKLSSSYLVVSLMISTTLTSLLLATKMKSSTIPFILFLSIIGGLMILFLYMTSTSKKTSFKMDKMSLFLLSLILVVMTKKEKTITAYNNIDPSMMYSIYTSSMTIMMIIMLVLLMAKTIKICSETNKPFRRKLKI